MDPQKSPLEFSSSPPLASRRPVPSAAGGSRPSVPPRLAQQPGSSPVRPVLFSPGRRSRLDDHAEVKQSLVRGPTGAYTPVRPKRRPSLRNVVSTPGFPTVQVPPNFYLGMPHQPSGGGLATSREGSQPQQVVRPPPAGVKIARLGSHGRVSRKPIPSPFLAGAVADAAEHESPPDARSADAWLCESLDDAADAAPSRASALHPADRPGSWLSPYVASDADARRTIAQEPEVAAPETDPTSSTELTPPVTKVNIPAPMSPPASLSPPVKPRSPRAIVDVEIPTVTAQKRKAAPNSAISVLSKVLQTFGEDDAPSSAKLPGQDRSCSPLQQAVTLSCPLGPSPLGDDSDDVFTDPELPSSSSNSEDSTSSKADACGEPQAFTVPFWPDKDSRMWISSSFMSLTIPEDQDVSPQPKQNAKGAAAETLTKEPVQSRKPLTDEADARESGASIAISIPEPSSPQERGDRPEGTLCSCQPVIRFAFGGSVTPKPCTCKQGSVRALGPSHRLPPSSFASSPRPGASPRRAHRINRAVKSADSAVPRITVTHAPLSISSSYPDLPLLSRAMFDFRPELLEDRGDERLRVLGPTTAAACWEADQDMTARESSEALDAAAGLVCMEVDAGQSVPPGLASPRSTWDECLARLIRIRNLKDASAFVELSQQVDDYLSDFLNFKHLRHLQSTFDQLSALLYSLAHPTHQLESIAATCPRLREVDLAAVSPPSLRAEPLVLPAILQSILSDDERRSRLAHAEAFLHLQAMERLFDIMCSGFSCLLSDARMPHQGPLALALFCTTLHKRLNWALGIYPSFDAAAQSGVQVFSATVHVAVDQADRLGCSMLPEPSSVFVHALQKEFKSALQRGYLVRDRISCLAAVPIPRRKSNATVPPKPSREQQKLEELQSIARGEMTQEEYKDKERKAAVKGNPRHTFVSIGAVRFLGELYKVGILPLSTVRDWLRRLLFDTARPELPSIWELECACALLITCGEVLEKDVQKCRCSTHTTRPMLLTHKTLDSTRPSPGKPDVSTLQPDSSLSSDKIFRKNSAPASHWINCAPPPSPGYRADYFSPRKGRCFLSSPLPEQLKHDSKMPIYSPSSPLYGPTETTLLKMNDGCTCDGVRLLDRATEKLKEVHGCDDFTPAVKEWVKAVIDLRAQKWHPLAARFAAQKAFVARPKEARAAAAAAASARAQQGSDKKP